MGVVLTMTMIIITALAITRERERGTMENLLSTPARPLEVMIGKDPALHPGWVCAGHIDPAGGALPLPSADGGQPPSLYAVVLLFIAANLAVGITFSTLAQNQLQAMQMAFFFFLPSHLALGFHVSVPRDARSGRNALGRGLPLTHFLRIVRGILLKGNGPLEILPELWPIALFMAVAMIVGLKRYRQTLD